MTTMLLLSQRGAAAPSPTIPAGVMPLPPPGYAIAQLADGRCLPLTALTLPHEDSATDALVSLYEFFWQAELIPPAEGEWPGSGPIICDSSAEALSWCERRSETPQRLLEAGRQAVLSECYPERSVWYRDELVSRLCEMGYSWPQSEPDGPCFLVANPSGVTAWLDADSLSLPALHLRVEATNLDEVWECLYTAVVEALGREAVCP